MTGSERPSRGSQLCPTRQRARVAVGDRKDVETRTASATRSQRRTAPFRRRITGGARGRQEKGTATAGEPSASLSPGLVAGDPAVGPDSTLAGTPPLQPVRPEPTGARVPGSANARHLDAG